MWSKHDYDALNKDPNAPADPPLNILLLGSGGREHALAHSLSLSPLVNQIYCVPGNGGTASTRKCTNHTSIDPAVDFSTLLQFAEARKVNLLVPGPEEPLVKGVVDYFKENGPANILCFGPGKDAARLEGEKAYAKDFMKRNGVPTAEFKTFKEFEPAKSFLEGEGKAKKWVIKATGLAAGKGVVIPQTIEEAVQAVKAMLVDRQFGDAGAEVVVEEFLEGEEISVLTFCDGYTFWSLPAAQDHKRVNDGDQGLNTGGMGAYAPAQIATKEVMARIEKEVLAPTFAGLRKERAPFVGCLFTGHVLTKEGPKVLEYNVRFGDPESQTCLPLLDVDLADVMVRCTEGCLDSLDIKIKPICATTVVAAAGGYPGKYAKGIKMQVSDVEPGTMLYHAGTAQEGSEFVTTGGRVIAATALGSTIQKAVDRAYKGISKVKFENMHYRKDIARRELERKPESLTYASAGVSIDAGNSLIDRIKPLVKATARPGAQAQIGGFGGEFSLRDAGYGPDAPTLVCAIDGIGTKLMIAQAAEKYDTVGIDLVAMNVNDLVVQGAEPLAFLDYYACSRLDVNSTADFVKGVAEGCKQAACALVGGETAEMPGLYKPGDFDAGGCAVGALPANAMMLPDKNSMRDGDILLGLASNGAHSNGFSLVRKIVARENLTYASSCPWDSEASLGAALLQPTRIYVKPLLAALKKFHPRPDSATVIKGIAHITGGGLVDNIPRMLPDSLSAQVECGTWHIPASLKWLRQHGQLESAEFARTFNTGLGMVLVVDAAQATKVKDELFTQGEEVFEVGKIVPRAGKDGCILNSVEKLSS